MYCSLWPLYGLALQLLSSQKNVFGKFNYKKLRHSEGCSEVKGQCPYSIQQYSGSYYCILYYYTSPRTFTELCLIQKLKNDCASQPSSQTCDGRSWPRIHLLQFLFRQICETFREWNFKYYNFLSPQLMIYSSYSYTLIFPTKSLFSIRLILICITLCLLSYS